ncbi:MAG: hypothetical protein ABSF44_02435 [Candidatus Bathyarchaeia archaeon]
MSYRGQKKGSYAPYKKSRFSWVRSKKAKPKENITDIKDDPEPQSSKDDSEPQKVRDEPEPQTVAPETISWQNRPLAPDIRIFLVRPETLTVTGARTILPVDLTLQKELGYQIALLAESQRLNIEAQSGDGSVKKYRILKISSQLPTDKNLSFSDYPLVGNIKNSLGPHGYTILPQ